MKANGVTIFWGIHALLLNASFSREIGAKTGPLDRWVEDLDWSDPDDEAHILRPLEFGPISLV